MFEYYNSSRFHLKKYIENIANHTEPYSYILDAGAGICLYKSLFCIHNYESADFCQVDKKYGEIDYVCDLSKIPVPDNRYQVVLLNQVLEHLKDPLPVLKEMKRVLKPGGKLIISVPFYYEEHEQPYDFYRYTQFGLKHLCNIVDLKIINFEWLEGYYGTLAYQCDQAAKGLGFPWNILFRPLANIFCRLDMRHKITNVGHPKNYVLTVKA